MRHNYTTCDRCEAMDTNTKGEFREVTGSKRLDLCQPCWDLFLVWIANENPSPSARKEPAKDAEGRKLSTTEPTTKKSPSIGVPAAGAKAAGPNPPTRGEGR